MNLYLEQLKLHKKSLEFSLQETEADIQYFEECLKRRHAQKENVLAGITLANESIANEENGDKK